MSVNLNDRSFIESNNLTKKHFIRYPARAYITGANPLFPSVLKRLFKVSLTIDPMYVDRTYYLAPDGGVPADAFAVVREAGVRLASYAF